MLRLRASREGPAPSSCIEASTISKPHGFKRRTPAGPRRYAIRGLSRNPSAPARPGSVVLAESPRRHTANSPCNHGRRGYDHERLERFNGQRAL